MHGYLNERRINPKMHGMDNECPDTVKIYLCNNKITFQLVPPHIHSTNAAEKAISTFKDHFLSGLFSVYPKFPMYLWCRLILVATTTLNILCLLRINPISWMKISSTYPLNIIKHRLRPLAPKFSCMKHLKNAAPGCRMASKAVTSAQCRITSVTTAFLCPGLARNASRGPWSYFPKTFSFQPPRLLTPPSS